MSIALRGFCKGKPETDEDWIIYPELQKKVEKLIINSLVTQFGASATQSIIQTGAHWSGQTKSDIFSDFDNFVHTIEEVFGERGHRIILDCLNMADFIPDHGSLIYKMGKRTRPHTLDYIKYTQ